jgi:hypothetical protein
MVPLAFIISPNAFTLGTVFVFLGTASLRVWGITERPFGTISDAKTGIPIPFALITLNDLSGKRVGFAVSDEQGRYFIVAEHGTYELTVFTPATIVPPRQFKGRVDVKKGWLTRPISF